MVAEAKIDLECVIIIIIMRDDVRTLIIKVCMIVDRASIGSRGLDI